MKRSTPFRTVLAAAAIGGLAVACGPARAAGPDPTTPPDDEAPLADFDEVSFLHDDFEPVALPNGWTLEPCLGDAPVLCVQDGEAAIGAVRLAEYPAEPDADLASDVQDLYDSLSAERAETCGPDYVLLPEPAQRLEVDDSPSVRFAYTATRGGAATERFVGVIVNTPDARYSVVIEGYTEDACVAVDETVFTPTDLDRFEPWFLDLVQAAELGAVS